MVALQVAVNPEAAARRKQQRSTAKKEGRKRKNAMFAYVSEPSNVRSSRDRFCLRDNKGRLKRRKES
jgi:hypothetical protein